jgi:hypothetical protein
LKDGTKIDFEGDLTKTLQKLIAGKKILATTVSPNLFNVDPQTISDKKDWVKLNECQTMMAGSGSGSSFAPAENQATLQPNKQNMWLWVLLVILIALIVFLFMKK